MRWPVMICLLAFVSCAHDRAPASLGDQPQAHDSVALGNVKAEAVKIAENKSVCFDIKITMTGVDQSAAHPSNWTVSWIDKKEQVNPLKLSHRGPASTPQGGTVVAPYGAYEKWSNTFKTCAPGANVNEVKSLILTPKELPYRGENELRLSWN